MNSPRRYFLLDALRGVAAFAVIVWHFQMFYFVPDGVLPPDYVRSAQPFYAPLWLFYNHGLHAVQLFWVLSGFVFYSVYANNVASRKVGARQFFVRRFSRLYPLHLATLLFVAALQGFSEVTMGVSFGYHENDLKHFLLNLAMVSHWGFQDGWSFNAPIWSVSLEIVAYGAFFVLATLRLHQLLPTIVAFAGSVLLYQVSPEFGWVLGCFFMGGCSYWVLHFVAGTSQNILIATFLVAIGAFVALSISLSLFQFYKPLLVWLRSVLLYPCLILVLSTLQMLKPDLGKSLRILGDVSYSSYLLHFPILLLILVASYSFEISITLNGAFLVAWLVVIYLLSFACFHKFERPMQNYLRTRLD